MSNRSGGTFAKPLYYLTTILDPRYKNCYFDTVTRQETINSNPAAETTSDGSGCSLLGVHNEILEENSTIKQEVDLTSPMGVQVIRTNPLFK